MKIRGMMQTLAIALIVALMSAGTSAQSANKARVEGTWTVTITVPADGFELTARLTFLKGATPSEGALISTNSVDSFYCSTGQGVWTRTGRREFSTSHELFCFSAVPETLGAPDGSAVLRERIVLDEAGGAFTGTGSIEFLGPDGASLGIAEYTVRGARVRTPAP
jgi:hypothetical protein